MTLQNLLPFRPCGTTTQRAHPRPGRFRRRHVVNERCWVIAAEFDAWFAVQFLDEMTMPVRPALEGRQCFGPGSAHCGGLRFDFAATPSVGLHRFANGQRPLGQMRTESRAGLISRHRTGHLGMIGLAV